MPKQDVSPDVVIELTDEQKQQIAPLLQRRNTNNAGMIFGSVGLLNGGNTIGLSYIPHYLAKRIHDLANRELGGETDVNS